MTRAELDAKVAEAKEKLAVHTGVAASRARSWEVVEFQAILDALTLQQAELVRLRAALAALPEYSQIASKGDGGECPVCGGLDPSVP